jgi:Sec-independent protein translocase protein TatA
MISVVGLLLFLGLIVLGPKKTIEIAQEAGRVLARAKHAAAQFQQSALEPDQVRHTAESSSSPVSPPQVPPVDASSV